MYGIEYLGQELLEEACRMRASDVHIVPREKEASVSFRVDADLIQQRIIDKKSGERLIAHFKFLSSMDIGERRRPQNGSLAVMLRRGQVFVRLSTLPTVNDESLVIRILPQDHVPKTKYLSLFPKASARLLSFLNHSHGLILFTGPTNSGKTTTLYSLIQFAKKHFNRNIITLEDPVETRNEEVLQVQVNEKAGITYAAGLRAILRHDPDMIVLGEIRDAETARTAIRAALTGHLVMSTLHAKNAKGALYRMLEFGVTMNELEQTMVAIAAQRLIELACPFCGETCELYCKLNRSVRRTNVFELLYGKELGECIKEAKGEYAHSSYETLQRLIRKGVALGYLSKSTYHRWVYEEANL
ncbi:competence type IV pilus ATPase ComGA [Bacillus altitudinis]|uniref:competence type IV pilus ATPase ComGA n=1 Tax=Bacillus TaxID=1386 RepID=UPI00030697F4|nr:MULTISPECIES: competence type IV pilus ATPase ComGA [Bacillus]MCA0925585.1 GspE/PulE family protein [Bacillus stratosphericus]CVM16875.1 PilB-like pili biogenesis ATPase [Streptococcus pneumoniae]MBS4747871.1 competence protein ComG [Bacillus altitudinis]MCL7871187.1 GspE/PulE family protein [Bacillus altitudinis]MCY7580896.1 GspE/PulE family protein [Bacillus altitudinis]